MRRAKRNPAAATAPPPMRKAERYDDALTTIPAMGTPISAEGI
jgi:hypothetical protein